jgi:mono/diheme cytochrome c family protein
MNTVTKPRKLLLAQLAALLVAASAAAHAAEPAVVDVGKYEYDGSCAVCHGPAGKGNGPLSLQLSRPVPDLTLLARRNHGVFPFSRVYQIIDGREEIAAHGTRDMPVWGRIFSRQSSIYFENYPPMDQEAAVRSRILALTEYIYRLQAK